MAEKVTYEIDSARCIFCEFCIDACPVEAISPLGRIRITEEKCTGCAKCVKVCPSGAIRPKKAE